MPEKQTSEPEVVIVDKVADAESNFRDLLSGDISLSETPEPKQEETPAPEAKEEPVKKAEPEAKEEPKASKPIFNPMAQEPEKKEEEETPKEPVLKEEPYKLPEGQNAPKDAPQWAAAKTAWTSEIEKERQRAELAEANYQKTRAEVEEMHKRFKDPEEASKRLALADELEEVVKLLDIKKTPEFRDKITVPKQRASDSFDAIAEEYEISAKLSELSKLSGRKLDDRIDGIIQESGLKGMSLSAFSKSISDYKQLSAEEADVEANSGERLAQYEQSEKDKEVAAINRQAERWQGDTGITLKRQETTDDMDDAVKARVEQYNTAIDGLREGVEARIFNPSDADGRAKTAYSAQVADTIMPIVVSGMLETMESMKSENQSLLEEIKSIKGAKFKQPGREFTPSESKPKTIEEAASSFDNLIKEITG